MEFETLNRIDELSESDWQACLSSDYPFLNYAFLHALESSGSVSSETGWTPQHLMVRDQGELLAGIPLYLKSHSWGEYVFDQEWGNAFHRYGMHYYPKLLNAMPFTPATGPRWFTTRDNAELSLSIVKACLDKVEASNLSSFHCLFPEESHHQALFELGLMKRYACQFHWFNKGYQSFDDFLEMFASRKRKNVRKERKAVHDLGLTFLRQSGSEMSDVAWIKFYEFYASTYYKRGHSPHLNLEFFQLLSKSLGDSILVDWVLSPDDNSAIAAALFFKDRDTLYGRYWGCKREIQGLHFEVCFYRGIEYAIANGIKRFDPGAQGEHKISRGFEPIETTSFHYISHPGFREAIEKFVAEEKGYIDQYREAAAERLPFKRG